jgi:hypothetical protein
MADASRSNMSSKPSSTAVQKQAEIAKKLAERTGLGEELFVPIDGGR